MWRGEAQGLPRVPLQGRKLRFRHRQLLGVQLAERRGDQRSPGLQMMLRSVRYLWQDLRRVHILVPLEKELEEEGKLASQSWADHSNGGPLAGGTGR